MNIQIFIHKYIFNIFHQIINKIEFNTVIKIIFKVYNNGINNKQMIYNNVINIINKEYLKYKRKNLKKQDLNMLKKY